MFGRSRFLTAAIVAWAVATVASADERKQALPDGKTIDTLQYSHSPKLLGSQATLSITRGGKIAYSYASQPHTGSGGKVVQKSWTIPGRDASALLDGLVRDGLLELEDVGRALYPHHHVTMSYGRWTMSTHVKNWPDKLHARLLPLLAEAHPAEWKRDEKPKQGAAEDDLKKMQGTWTLIGLEREGKLDSSMLTRNVPFSATVDVKADRMIAEFAHGDHRFTHTGTIVLDPGATPKGIDFSITNPESKEVSIWRGVYAIHDRQLKIRWGQPESGVRPKELDVKKGISGTTSVFVRVKN